MQRVVISQPMYFPWAGFLSQLAMADTLIWLDDVQFSKGSFTNRIQIQTPQGLKWMTVPLQGRGRGSTISELRVADANTSAKHRSILQRSFAESAYVSDALEVFDLAWSYSSLSEILIASATLLAEAVGVAPQRTFLSSTMEVAGKGSERVLGLVKSVGGDTYITGHGGRHYLEHGAFEDAGIEVEYMNYQIHPWHTPRTHFVDTVSALDLVANAAPADRISHLASETRTWRCSGAYPQ